MTSPARRSRKRPRAAGGRPHEQRPFDRRFDANWVEGAGVVWRLLSDDEEDERHQRFVLDLRNGTTLLIAHNLKIADRVPLGMGDRVRFRGLFEWNPSGGMVHWTHHDPLGEEEGGWLEWRGSRYA